jgi:hypothetical protein
MLKTFAAVAGSLLLLSVPATALAGESPRKCGTVSGGIAMYDIKATGVSCASARKTARAWRTALVAGECADGRFRCKARGFTCRAKRPAEVHYPVTCKQGAQRVRWDIHAD